MGQAISIRFASNLLFFSGQSLALPLDDAWLLTRGSGVSINSDKPCTEYFSFLNDASYFGTKEKEKSMAVVFFCNLKNGKYRMNADSGTAGVQTL